MKLSLLALAAIAATSFGAPVAAPEPAPVPTDYATYGTYPPPTGGYAEYGKYPGAGTSPPANPPPAPADGYGTYGTYPPPGGGYATYGTYKRALDWIKKAFKL